MGLGPICIAVCLGVVLAGGTSQVAASLLARGASKMLPKPFRLVDSKGEVVGESAHLADMGPNMDMEL